MKYLTLLVFALLTACGGGGGSPPAALAPVADTQSAAAPEVEKALDSTWSKVADEGGTFTLTAATVVQYGAGTTFNSKTLSGTVKCTNATFGDPVFGKVKACYTQSTAPVPVPVTPPPATDTKIAVEGASFAVAAGTVVRYGVDSRWITKTISGAGQCTNAFFGSDPAPFVVKACFAAAAVVPPVVVEPPPVVVPPVVVPPPVVTPPVTEPPPVTPVAGDVVDSTGAVVPAAYRAIASQMGRDLGIAYRYGPSAAEAGYAMPSLPTLYKPTDKFSRCNGTPLPDGSNCNTAWQIGGPRNFDGTNDQGLAGLYSTNQANVTFVADNPSIRAGVGDLQVSGFEFNTYAEKPQLLWQCGGCGLDSQNVADYMRTGALKMDGSARPIATARCGGPAGFCGSSVVVFQDGTLATAGSTTSRNKTLAKLAPNKVPTGIAMTNQSEYVLVTVWDTVALKGQVAVVATAGLCDGCKVGGPYYEWWHEWWGVYPGLPNMGNIGFMKVLGYIDLPGMAAPTEIAATTGLHQFNTVYAGGSFMGFDNSPLSAHWQSFAAGGGNFGRYAKGAVAVVISKSEQKAAFIDLKPLMSYMHGVYFSAGVSQVTNVGQGAGQWPPTFDEGAAMPAVVKMVDLGARPTAVKTTVTVTGGAARAWIATQDGSLRIFSLGGYAPGGATASPSPADIAAKGVVAVGRNPTSLGTSKGDPANDDPVNTQILVASRGDRKVQWVRFAADGNSGTVTRTLQDSRMTDPIAVEDIDNFANVGYTLSVADYSGKSVLNYRYGPVIPADRGANWYCQATCPTTGGPIEFGGAFVMQGKPFQINTSNVP